MGGSVVVKVESVIEVARSSDDVFAFVADQTNAPRWQSGIIEVRRLTDPRIRATIASEQISLISYADYPNLQKAHAPSRQS